MVKSLKLAAIRVRIDRNKICIIRYIVLNFWLIFLHVLKVLSEPLDKSNTEDERKYQVPSN